MRETRADTAQALLFALLLHLLLFGLAFLGLRLPRDSAAAAAGSPVQADLVDPAALSAAMRRTLTTPVKPAPQPAETPAPPQPLPVQRPQQAPVPPQAQAQERVPVPDAIDQARVDRDALSAKQAARELDARRRQQQIDLTERKRQAEAEQQQRLLAQQLAAIRKAQDKAARQAEQAQQRLQQIADARAQRASTAESAATVPPGTNGVDNSLLAQYTAAIQTAIRAQWVKPDNVADGATCRLTIRQLPGGEVMPGSVTFGLPCDFDATARSSIERAVLKAQPLPYAGFEPVFNRTLLLTFRAEPQ